LVFKGLSNSYPRNVLLRKEWRMNCGRKLEKQKKTSMTSLLQILGRCKQVQLKGSQKGKKASHLPQYQRYLKPQTLYCTPLILRYKHLRPQTMG